MLLQIVLHLVTFKNRLQIAVFSNIQKVTSDVVKVNIFSDILNFAKLSGFVEYHSKSYYF